MNETLYMHIAKNIEVNKKEVYLGDISSLWCQNKTTLAKCKAIKVMNIKSKQDDRYVYATIKMIELIQEMDPDLEVDTIGEPEFLIDYRVPHPPNMVLQWVKTAMVCLVTFCGGAIAIMTFNNDGSMGKIFQQIYLSVMGRPSNGRTILELSYSIGLSIGILVFFNHFKWKKMLLDPTPIEIKMRLYEDDVNTAMIKGANREESEIDVR